MVEAPALYAHLTGRENLEVHRRLLALPKRAIDEVLETVDLLPAAGKLVRHYSSGLKQRSGLAQALLGAPDLLLLDEPTNRLDPAGIHKVRSLVRELPQRRRMTVFSIQSSTGGSRTSSHPLRDHLAGPIEVRGHAGGTPHA